jgi:acyl-CoA thioesterase-1
MNPHIPLRLAVSLASILFALAPFVRASPEQPGEAPALEKADVDDMLKIAVPEHTQESPEKSNDGSKLPRILLLGDSISGGYVGPVSSHLKGKAFVMRGNNGGLTTAGLENLDETLGDEPWDLIHFNWGLHEMTFQSRLTPEQRGIDPYAARLEQLVVRLKATGAKLIWATTTPWCPEPYEYAAKRLKVNLQYSAEEEKQWKDAALKVMKKHDIPVNDLHALLLPRLQDYLKRPDDIHFNREGSATMGRQIAVVSSQLLKLEPDPER